MPKAKKGGGFERDFCKYLSSWFTEHVRDDIFWRSSQSGGRATIRFSKGLTTAGAQGDVCSLDEIGLPLTDNIIFELKRGYNGMDFFNLIDFRGKKPHLLDQWLEKLESEVKNTTKKTFWLILRRDKRQVAIIMPSSFFNKLEQWNGKYKDNLVIYWKKVDKKNYTIINGDEFFTWLNPDSLIQFIASEETH